MSIKLVKPQKVVGDTGWTVQIANRFELEHIDGKGVACLKIEFGPVAELSYNSLHYRGTGNKPSDPDARLICEHIEASLKLMGILFEWSNQN